MIVRRFLPNKSGLVKLYTHIPASVKAVTPQKIYLVILWAFWERFCVEIFTACQTYQSINKKTMVMIGMIINLFIVCLSVVPTYCHKCTNLFITIIRLFVAKKLCLFNKNSNTTREVQWCGFLWWMVDKQKRLKLHRSSLFCVLKVI